MDAATAILVAGLCAITFPVAVTVRREFRTGSANAASRRASPATPAANPEPPAA